MDKFELCPMFDFTTVEKVESCLLSTRFREKIFHYSQMIIYLSLFRVLLALSSRFTQHDRSSLTLRPCKRNFSNLYIFSNLKIFPFFSKNSKLSKYFFEKKMFQLFKSFINPIPKSHKKFYPLIAHLLSKNLSISCFIFQVGVVDDGG